MNFIVLESKHIFKSEHVRMYLIRIDSIGYQAQNLKIFISKKPLSLFKSSLNALQY